MSCEALCAGMITIKPCPQKTKARNKACCGLTLPAVCEAVRCSNGRTALNAKSKCTRSHSPSFIANRREYYQRPDRQTVDENMSDSNFPSAGRRNARFAYPGPCNYPFAEVFGCNFIKYMSVLSWRKMSDTRSQHSQ